MRSIRGAATSLLVRQNLALSVDATASYLHRARCRPPLLLPASRFSSSAAQNQPEASSSAQEGRGGSQEPIAVDADGGSAATSSPSTPSASAHLFALAEEEERLAEVRREPKIPELRERGWDGEEPQAVLIRRILEDTHKPLRVKGWEKKLPQPAPLESRLFSAAEGEEKEGRLIPTGAVTPATIKVAKMPWEVEFKAPDAHKEAPTRPPRGRIASGMSSPGARVTQKRLFAAKEASLDYRVGYRDEAKAKTYVPVSEHRGGRGEKAPSGSSGGHRNVVPGMRAWNGFIEEKIEQARRDGLFKQLKGRGKPIPRDPAESNPFIAREDFLINRIIKTQGAAPPWVELQRELDENIGTFRSMLRDHWTRRAVRVKSLSAITLSDITEIHEGWRDREWEEREKSYHEAFLLDLNNLARKYNVVAPYQVRRMLLSLEPELDRCVRDCAAHIANELGRRMRGEVTPNTQMKGASTGTRARKEDEDIDMSLDLAGTAIRTKAVAQESMWETLKRGVREGFGR